MHIGLLDVVQFSSTFSDPTYNIRDRPSLDSPSKTSVPSSLVRDRKTTSLSTKSINSSNFSNFSSGSSGASSSSYHGLSINSRVSMNKAKAEAIGKEFCIIFSDPSFSLSLSGCVCMCISALSACS